MKYCQIDEITSLEPGKKLVATRKLRAEEDYLLDHFPRFPVMPGVMMLEALHQAAIWMVRTGDDFGASLVVLREAKSVKFGDFLSPGETLQITVQALKQDGDRITVKASAEKEGKVTVSARLVLEKTSTNDPARLGTDDVIRQRSKLQFGKLFGEVAGLG